MFCADVCAAAAFRLFGSPHDGIPRHTFRKLLRQKLGISIDEPMSELVFNAIDDNGTRMCNAVIDHTPVADCGWGIQTRVTLTSTSW